MDQGTLLECFCLHSVDHKVVNQRKTQKMVIGKYSHCKRSSINQVS